MVKIVAVFKNGLGKSHTWSFLNPDQKKTNAEVKSLLQRLTHVKLFHKDGAVLFDSVESAKYVETTEKVIF